MLEIADTDKYSIRINQDKNRLYLKIKGPWHTRDEVPCYLADLKFAVFQLRSGFTCVTDMSRMKSLDAEAALIFEIGAHMLVRNGVTRNAGIFNHNNSFHPVLGKKFFYTGEKQAFYRFTEAERWLDS